ncbi:GTP 3',8-cyclase MoaA [Synechococcus sp. PCC 7336]|uniref:GTP 3',8-cyclase MoaA n=1 Tax=Synechococcus sp. PCC 7336 TaxID=195250 RepID=UPI00034B7967|nr:GTP 3',8-cyclase MoaA [Synechococcus sp. PCC 7336]
MKDVNYLRISLIDRCNFRCQYCMPGDEEMAWLDRDVLLTRAEIVSLVRDVFMPLGFNRFRLTGGEPLLRQDAIAIVSDLSRLDGLVDLALTTNAFILADKARALYDAGLRRINISLDSLNADTFRQITGRDLWHNVWAGIQAAYDVGFDPLKLNVVVIPGVNDREVEALAALSIDRAWHVRFIEFMPIGNSTLFSDKGWIDSADLRQRIRAKYGLESASVRGSGPADIFRIPQAKGTLGFISQMSDCFCDNCNRIRLSADGWLRPCLLNESGQIDLKASLRKGYPPDRLRERVRQLLSEKAEIHFKDRDRGTRDRYSRTMSQIGG